MGWSQDLFRALWRSLSREVKEHVGTDQFGNKYYCIPQYKNWRGEEGARAATAWSVKEGKVRAPSQLTHHETLRVNLIISSIYIYMQEIVKNEKYREVKIKSQDFCEKEKLLSKETSEELLPPPVQTQIKGHASAPYFGKEEPSVAPSSTGKTFQPGSWVPQDGKSHSQ
ncbi:Myc-induced mitochondrial protein [Macaca fascicularis]|uniref:Myc-induced mitochondrial protein n=1 Tax=Macaca fascicularis TaxID=9541 RepID=G7P7K8_MACFA|nr:Myc-induced mitochondrial protein [Macaca fascicularis]